MEKWPVSAEFQQFYLMEFYLSTWSWKDKGMASSWESHAHFTWVHFTGYLAMSHQTFLPPVYVNAPLCNKGRMRQQSNGTARFGHCIMARRVCQSLNKRASSCSRTALWNTLVFSYETTHFPNHMTVTHLLLSLLFQSRFIILINLHNPHVWQFP